MAVVLGTLLGLLAGGVRTIDRARNPTLEFARAMPPAAVIPIATLLIGYNEPMKVAVVASAATCRSSSTAARRCAAWIRS